MIDYVKKGNLEMPDGASLDYLVRGQGLPLVFCNGLGVSFTSFWSGICAVLSEQYQVICWNYRGHGASDSPDSPELFGIDSCAMDLSCVLDQLGIEKAILVGHSMGVQVLFEFYRHFPERAMALIPMLGTYRHPFNTFMRMKKGAEFFRFCSNQAFRYPEVMEKVWPHFFHVPVAKMFLRFVEFVHPSLFPNKELHLYLSHMQKIDPYVFFHLASHMQNHSAADLLEKISVPCLVFAGEYDLFTPLELSLEMVEKIPKAELQLIRHGSHAAMVEQSDLFSLRMILFLQTYFPEDSGET